MSLPVRGDSAIRYTDVGQSYLHYLGGPVRNPTVNPVQDVHRYWSADLATLRAVAIGSGVQDLSCTLPWDGNPDSLARMIVALRRGATAELFPSLTNPSLSFPCTLVEAGEIQPDPQFWHDRRHTVDVQLRRTDGGSWQSLLEAPLFYYRGGMSLPGLTFTRTGDPSNAWAPDEDGIYQQAGEGLFRTGWVESGGVRTPAYFGAPAATNEILDSADVDVSASANWAANVAWTEADVPSLFQGQTATRYTNDDATGSHYAQQDIASALPATPVVGSVIIEQLDTLDSSFGIYDNTVLGFVIRGNYTWATDSIVISEEQAGSSVGVRSRILSESGPNGGRVVRLEAFGTPDNAGNDARFFIYPCGVGVNSRSAVVHHAQYEAGVVATSPIVTAGSTLTRNGEILYGAYPHARDVEITVYVRMLEWGTAALGPPTGGSVRVFEIGEDAARLGIIANAVTPEYQAVHTTGGADRFTASSLPAVSIGQEVELRVVLSESSFLLGQSLDGGAETTAAGTAGLGTIPWEVPRLHIGSASVGGNTVGLNPIIALKVLPGIKTMAECRAA